MATTFDLTTYPLSDRSRFVDDHTVARDLLDDGTMRIRVLGASTFRIIRCVFEHLTEADAATFEAYLITNRATLFDMVFPFDSPVTTYQGYIWSTPQNTVTNGTFHVVSFDFRGVVV